MHHEVIKDIFVKLKSKAIVIFLSNSITLFYKLLLSSRYISYIFKLTKLVLVVFGSFEFCKYRTILLLIVYLFPSVIYIGVKLLYGCLVVNWRKARRLTVRFKKWYCRLWKSEDQERTCQSILNSSEPKLTKQMSRLKPGRAAGIHREMRWSRGLETRKWIPKYLQS